MLKISRQEVKCLLLKNSDPNKMIFCQREDLKVKLPITKIISLQLLKKIKALNQEDNLRLVENLKGLRIILNNLIRKKE